MMSLLSIVAALMMQAGATPPPGELKTVAKGLDSAVDEGRNVAVRTEAEWAKVWRTHTFEGAAPKVDFTREMVVGVFMGSRPTAGFGVEIVGTREAGGALIVEYRESTPARGQMTAQVLTSPYHLVSVPRRDGDVKFERVP